MASVQKHGSKFRVKWYPDGRAGGVRYESFATKKEADAAARRVEAMTVLDGKPPEVIDPDALTLAKWWARWEPGRPWAASTRAARVGHWNLYIEPVFGKVTLDAIKTADVATWCRKLEDGGLAGGTVIAARATLSAVLQAAADDGLLARNPVTGARMPRATKKEAPAFDIATTARLLDAIAQTTPGLALCARLVADTGLRRAEAAGLTWDRMDLDACVLTIDRQYNRGFLPTKTRKTRKVPVTTALAAALREHRAAQSVQPIGGDGFVFARDDGSAWPVYEMTKAWRRAADLLTNAGTPLPPDTRGWHNLRHTATSRLMESGVPVATVAQMIGDTQDVLLRTYSHVSDEAAAHDRIRAALDG